MKPSPEMQPHFIRALTPEDMEVQIRINFAGFANALYVLTAVVSALAGI